MTEEAKGKDQSPAIDNENKEYQPVEVNIKNLLKAGAHFGHKKEKWNPKMLPFIFGERNGVHIINLDLTLEAWQKARKYLHDIAARGGNALFVGTKQQARKPIEQAAARSGSYFMSSRWLGGTLSNFQTVKNSIKRMEQLEEMLRKADDPDSDVRLAKKEKLAITRQIERLDTNIGGIRGMKKLPDVLLVFDINKEAIAISEARKLHIPVIALVDSNVDPKPVTLAIPSNDDAARTIELFAEGMSDAILEGKKAYQRVDRSAFKKDQGSSAEANAENSESENASAAPVQGLPA